MISWLPLFAKQRRVITGAEGADVRITSAGRWGSLGRLVVTQLGGFSATSTMFVAGNSIIRDGSSTAARWAWPR